MAGKRLAGFVIPGCMLICCLPVLADLETCIGLDDDAARLACYDQVAGRTAQRNNVSVNELESSDFGMPPEKADQRSSMHARLSRVESSAHGKLLVYLENGQVWRQIDSGALPLAAGQNVVITAASFGSHLLEKQTGSRRIRVKRVR